MRLIYVLLLALALMAQAAAAQRTAHACCPEQACVMHCVDMGCATAVPPLAPPAAPVLFAALRPPAEHGEASPLALPSIVEEIWTPPD